MLSIKTFPNANVYYNTGKDPLLIEIKELFNTIDRQYREEAMIMADSLEYLWESNIFNTNQKEKIRNTFSAFKNMRLREWPEKVLYVKVLIEVTKTVNFPENFTGLHDSFEELLDIRNQRQFIRLLEKAHNLFKNNILYESHTAKWKFSNNKYIFEFDSVPIVRFNQRGDLLCYSQKDSIVIKQTAGVLFFNEEIWEGDMGKYTWERVHLDPDKVYSDFDSYQLNLTRSQFKIDSVRFTNLNFFTQSLYGELNERIVSDISPADARYPRFTSYDAILELKNLFPEMHYLGGFTMLGQRVLGTSAEGQDAKISIFRNDSLFVTAQAESFSIRPDRIISNRATVSIYISGDSIYHPGLTMRYLDNERELSLIRDKTGASRAPFQNSYHQIDMYCEAIYWNINSNMIQLRMTRGIGEKGVAIFESNNFFSNLRYMRLQGIESIHPLVKLSRYSREIGSREFSINDYARHLRLGTNVVKRQLLELSYFGFLSVELDEEFIIINDLLFHYIGSYAGINDYDVMQISSDAAINAELNLNNFDLKILGITRIPLSDAKNVVIYPFGETITLQKNRDIYFHGRIESGLFNFFGKEFFFEYEKFKIHLVNTDSMNFSVRTHEPDSRGQYSLRRVKPSLEGINGELLIDHPENKSGNRPYPHYPIFNSDNESFVYYDDFGIHRGAYNRENIYFKLTPFSIDSLDHATTENIAFDGVFVSTGVFPEFTESLTVQPDYSLGFNSHTPDEGYPVFEGKASYYGPIDMSYQGLEANGQLKYLNVTAEITHMFVFPDSARADVSLLTLESQSEPVEYPPVTGRDVDMLYLPNEDNLTFIYRETPIEIFYGLAHSKGSLTVSPDGLSGLGKLELFEGEMTSDSYTFRQNELEASGSTLELKTPDKKDTSFKLNGFETFVDVINQNSRFTASSDTSYIKLPINDYIVFMDKLDWNYENQEITMFNQRGREKFDLENLTKTELIDIDFKGCEFISTHRRRDSLSFYADNAKFDQRTNQIHAGGVKIIKIADAAIFPNNEEIFILPESEIRQLRNASIIADTSKRHHYLYNAEIDISSKNQYKGKAWYDYINDQDEKQELFFEQISVNNAGQTYGLCKAYIEDNFHITNMFPFKGDISLSAPEENFYYTGATKILADDCGLLNPNWFRFEARLSPDSIMIPVGEGLQNIDRNEIRTAIMLAGDSLHIYPALFSRRKHYLDQEIISAKGYLAFDRIINQYILTTEDKHINENLPDNIIRINPNNCEIRAEGDVKFHADMGQVDIKSYGNVIYNLKKNQLELDIVMKLDFFFTDNCLSIIKDTLSKVKGLREINLNRQKYIKALNNIFGEEAGTNLLKEMNLSNSLRRFPTQLDKTFFFADIRLHWDDNTNSFVSTRPIGIGNINRTILNKYVSGYFQYRKQRGGDVLTFYFEPATQLGTRPGGTWFYFYYTRGVMQSISSISEYNLIIDNTNPRNRRIEVERGETPYSFIKSAEYRPFSLFEEINNQNEF